jgi:hypothetical protein
MRRSCRSALEGVGGTSSQQQRLGGSTDQCAALTHAHRSLEAAPIFRFQVRQRRSAPTTLPSHTHPHTYKPLTRLTCARISRE